MKRRLNKEINISQPVVSRESIDLVNLVLRSGKITEGEIVHNLEEKICKYLNVKHTIAVNSGTAALHCAVHSLELNQNDKIITTPFTFVASINSILFDSVKVAFADIDLDDFNISPKSIAEVIDIKTKAIMAVDLYGQPAKYEALRKFHLPIIADSCQAIGADLKEKKTGTLGKISAFSTYATKNIFSAEGGFVTTDSDALADKCRIFKNHGQNPHQRYQYLGSGYNYRLADVLAAIALPQIEEIDDVTEIRNNNAQQYSEALKGVSGIILPTINKDTTHAFHQYTVRITEESPVSRDVLVRKLADRGIHAGIYYPKPIHLYKCFKFLGYKLGDFPNAEKAASEVVSLPVHQHLTRDDIQRVVENICDIIHEKK